jgi:uncharacterized repeat protein (TIGR03803 family)
LIYAFKGHPSDGSEPLGLTLSGNLLYGTTYNGGGENTGEVFGVAPPAPTQLFIKEQGTNMVVSWTNASFNLEVEAIAEGPYLMIPNASPYTNPLTAPAQFFRLKY